MTWEGIGNTHILASLEDKSLLVGEKGKMLEIDINKQIGAYENHLIQDIFKACAKRLVKKIKSGE